MSGGELERREREEETRIRERLKLHHIIFIMRVTPSTIVSMAPSSSGREYSTTDWRPWTPDSSQLVVSTEVNESDNK